MKKTIRVSYEKFVEEYKKHEWIKVGFWENIPNLPSSFFALAPDKEYYKYFEVLCDPVFYLFMRGEAYIPEDRVKPLHKFFSDKIDVKDFDLFSNIIAKSKKIYEEIEIFKSVVLKTNVNDKDFYNKLKNLFDKLILITSTFEFERVLSNVLEEKLAAKLKELGREDIYLPQLIEEDNYTDVGKLNLAIKSLAKKVKSGELGKNSENLKKEIETLTSKYAYMGTYLLTGKPYTPSDIEEMFDKTIEELDNDKEEEKPVFNDELIIKLIELVNMFSKNKFRRIEILNKTIYDLQPIYRDIAKEGYVEYDKVIGLCADEFLDYVKSGFKDIKSANDYNFMNYLDSDDSYVISDEESIRFKKDYLDKELEDVDELKGNTAFAGKAKGIVKVISGHKDFHKFEEGDVLVCSMTDPNYVPIMKASCAIVTDMGGVLSHAAIVAREMKKPCIINTKIATKVFKDGDLIKVDADNGIIKILEKAK